VRLRRRIPLALLLPLAAACSDSTAPDPAREAERLRTLAAAASDEGSSERALALNVAARIIERGARPDEIVVTLDGARAEWRAVMWEGALVLPLHYSQFVPPTRVLVAWRGGDSPIVLHAVLAGDQGSLVGGVGNPPLDIFVAGLATLSQGRHGAWAGTAGDFETALRGEGPACRPIDTALRDPRPVDPNPWLECREASFGLSLDATLHQVRHDARDAISPGPVPESRTVSIRGQRVRGVRLVMRCDLSEAMCAGGPLVVPLP
jgi:hypothetical protein